MELRRALEYEIRVNKILKEKNDEILDKEAESFLRDYKVFFPSFPSNVVEIHNDILEEVEVFRKKLPRVNKFEIDPFGFSFELTQPSKPLSGSGRKGSP